MMLNMEVINSNTPFVYVDRNPEMELIGYINLRNDSSSEEYFVEETIERELVA